MANSMREFVLYLLKKLKNIKNLTIKYNHRQMPHKRLVKIVFHFALLRKCNLVRYRPIRKFIYIS